MSIRFYNVWRATNLFLKKRTIYIGVKWCEPRQFHQKTAETLNMNSSDSGDFQKKHDKTDTHWPSIGHWPWGVARVARVARHPHATRVGETPGAQRATGSTHWPLGVWWTGGSADALVGALEGIGWQQVRQGGLETYLIYEDLMILCKLYVIFSVFGGVFMFFC
jgi:hypothetical protein